MRNVLIALATTGALLGAAGSASAANPNPQTTTFTVMASVQKNCSAVTAPTLNFGAYTPGAGQTLNVNTTVSIACTKGTTFTVSLNGGTGGNLVQRAMTDGVAGDALQYQLYTSNTYATVFGDGSGVTKTVVGTGTGMANQLSTIVYGQLTDSAANQATGANPTYTDTITVSVAY